MRCRRLVLAPLAKTLAHAVQNITLVQGWLCLVFPVGFALVLLLFPFTLALFLVIFPPLKQALLTI